MSAHISVVVVGYQRFTIYFILFGSGFITSLIITYHRQGTYFNPKLHLGALVFKHAYLNLTKIILSYSMCFLNQYFFKTNISSIYVFTTSIPPSSSYNLANEISPELHMPVGRRLYLNFQNSVTIFVM